VWDVLFGFAEKREQGRARHDKTPSIHFDDEARASSMYPAECSVVYIKRNHVIRLGTITEKSAKKGQGPVMVVSRVAKDRQNVGTDV